MKLWPFTKTVIETGSERWGSYSRWFPLSEPPLQYSRDYVIYKIVNNWTGSERIKKVYLN